MKLFQYDHCPYCVKARMIFGFKNVDFELITLLNDDEKTPMEMIGQKMVPILQKPDGSFLPESLDIISYIDGLSDFGPPMVKVFKKDVNLEKWFQEAYLCIYKLAMPRWIKISLQEFSTPSAVAYFVNKKEKMIGSFEKNLSHSGELIKTANKFLCDLEKAMSLKTFFHGDSLSMDDFHVFAKLRTLSCVKGLDFPQKIKDYMLSMEKKSKVPLHWNIAV